MIDAVAIFSQQNSERRTIGRTLINRGALVLFRGQKGVRCCCVRDVTNQGAGIRLDGLNIVPADFEISFDNFRSVRKCRLIWRNGNYLGATFVS